MKVVIVQQDIIWADPKANLAALDRIFAGLPAAELYVLPEMFTTGFATEPEGIAEEYSATAGRAAYADSGISAGGTACDDSGISAAGTGRTPDGKSCEGLEWMKAMAKSRDCAIAGSIAVHDDGKYCNRLFFVTPESVSFYDKHHLFTYSGEHLRYTAGDRKVTVEWRGWRIRLIVCYDLRFPKWIRNDAGAQAACSNEAASSIAEAGTAACNIEAATGIAEAESAAGSNKADTGSTGAGAAAGCAEQPYDAIICVASWPERRAGAWKTLSHARAIENQCYVLAVNRAGKDPACVYSGDSAIIDPWGETLASCTPSVEGFAAAELDKEALEAFRRQFPVLNDSD